MVFLVSHDPPRQDGILQCMAFGGFNWRFLLLHCSSYDCGPRQFALSRVDRAEWSGVWFDLDFHDQILCESASLRGYHENCQGGHTCQFDAYGRSFADFCWLWTPDYGHFLA